MALRLLRGRKTEEEEGAPLLQEGVLSLLNMVRFLLWFARSDVHDVTEREPENFWGLYLLWQRVPFTSISLPLQQYLILRPEVEHERKAGEV